MKRKQLKIETNLNTREKALALVNAYFDGKEIEIEDPMHGWISINNQLFWSHLDKFCQNVDKYRLKQ